MVGLLVLKVWLVGTVVVLMALVDVTMVLMMMMIRMMTWGRAVAVATGGV